VKNTFGSKKNHPPVALRLFFAGRGVLRLDEVGPKVKNTFGSKKT
jgi:hypothetical protein